MRQLRVRFTIRQVMVAVAVIALVLVLAQYAWVWFSKRSPGPTGFGSSMLHNAQYDVDGHKVRVRANATLVDHGIDSRYCWSIAVYGPDDRHRSNPVFEWHDLNHLFAVPLNSTLHPTLDHLLVIPLPAGEYNIQVSLLVFPRPVHRNGVLKGGINLRNFRQGGPPPKDSSHG